jgi:phage gp16-like protein
MNRITGAVRLSAAARDDLRAPRSKASPHRRALIGKVQVAKSQLGLLDDDYRRILFEVTGKRSAADLDDGQLIAVLKRFESVGFKPQKGKGPRPADHPSAGKARALWISLGQLGAIDNPSEQALEAMARRQLGCDRLQWANQALVYSLIEALKKIAERHGWGQCMDGIAPANRVIVLKRRLIEAQMAKLRLANWMPRDWDARRAAYAFGGVEVDSILAASLPELDRVAQALARAIADAKRAGAVK